MGELCASHYIHRQRVRRSILFLGKIAVVTEHYPDLYLYLILFGVYHFRTAVMNNHIIWLCVLDMRFLVLIGASAARG